MAIRIRNMDWRGRAEIYADNLSDVADLPTQTDAKGLQKVSTDSTCFVHGTGGNSTMFILKSEGVWVEL